MSVDGGAGGWAFLILICWLVTSKCCLCHPAEASEVISVIPVKTGPLERPCALSGEMSFVERGEDYRIAVVADYRATLRVRLREHTAMQAGEWRPVDPARAKFRIKIVDDPAKADFTVRFVDLIVGRTACD